jgi:hypothetical protein
VSEQPPAKKRAGLIKKETNLFSVLARRSFIQAPPLAASDQSDRKINWGMVLSSAILLGFADSTKQAGK